MTEGAFSRTGLLAGRLQRRPRSPQRLPELVCASGPAPAAPRPFSLLHNPYRWPCSLLCRHPAPLRPAEAASGDDLRLPLVLPSLPPPPPPPPPAGYRPDPAAAVGAASELGALLPEELLRRYAASENSLLETRPLAPRLRRTPEPATGQRAVVVLDLRGDLEGLLTVPPQEGESAGRAGRSRSCMRMLAPGGGGGGGGRRISTCGTLLAVSTLRPLPLRSRSSSSGSPRRYGVPVTPRRRRRRRRSVSPQRAPSEGDTETLMSSRPSHRRLPAAAASDQLCIAVPDMATLTPSTGQRKTKKGKKGKRAKKGKKKKGKVDPRLQKMEAFSTMMNALQTTYSVSRSRGKATTEKRFNKQLERAMAEYCDPEEPALFWLRLPRSFANRSCRFELPPDLSLLESLSPLQYLTDYTVVSRTREFVYSAAYGRHRSGGGVPTEDVWTALEEAVGGQLQAHQREQLLQLLAEPLPPLVSYPQLSGLAALCERLFATELSPAAAETGGGGRERLEVVDFQRLAVLLEGVKRPRADVITLLWRIRDQGD